MTYISSQRYLDRTTVEEKKEQIKSEKLVYIACSYVGIIDDEEFVMVVDGHHKMAAANELGIQIKFNIQDDSEKLTGEELLQARYNDSPYYDVANGVDVW